jgi:hypothetical protein
VSKKLLVVLCLTIALGAFSQSIKGKVNEQITNVALSNIQVKIVGNTFEKVVYTNADGEYEFKNINSGSYNIIVSIPDYYETNLDVEYDGKELNLNPITIEKIALSKITAAELPTTQLDDENAEQGSGNNVASLLNASRDAFVSAGSFTFSQARFSYRGYQTYDNIVYINNLPMQNLFRTSDVAYGDFSGLNDVLRSRTNYYGLKATTFTFGELATNVDIDAEAINQRKGLRFSGALSNRTFVGRGAATYSTGLLPNGWAFTASFNYRGASEAYIIGTAMQSISGYLGLSKKVNEKLTLSLTAFGSNNNRASNRGETKEYYNLYGSNYYNSSWGYQNGEKRSYRLRKDFAPIINLSGEWKPNVKTQINASIGLQTGWHSNQRMDWFNTQSPDPTYYKKAPSYYIDDPAKYNEMFGYLSTHKDELQLQWSDFYEANKNNIETVASKNTSGRRSIYWMYDDIQTINNLSANILINRQVSNKVNLIGGVMVQNAQSEFYKQVNDLLGGDFVVNVNQFAQLANPTSADAIQNDLNDPNRIVKVGDKYGYDYKANILNASGWLQAVVALNKVDFFGAVQLGNTTMSREGLYRNGAYKDISYGKGETVSFLSKSAKGGVTYKFNGKNYLSLNAYYTARPPEFSQVYVVSRTTNLVDKDARMSNVISSELSYNYKGPRIKGTLTGFYTQMNDLTNVVNFYTEATNNFGSYVIKGINQRFMGVEMSLDVQLPKGFSTQFVANLGDYRYTDRPTATFYYDYLQQVAPVETIYFKDMRVASGPQNAGTIKLNYRSKQFWQASINFNYFANSYVEMSPQRRTQSAVDNVDPNSTLYSSILTQEKLDNIFTVDASFSKSIYLNKMIKNLKKKMYLDINLSANNLLNNQTYAIVGREQMRFDFKENNPFKYANRYNYMMGVNFMFNVILRIN